MKFFFSIFQVHAPLKLIRKILLGSNREMWKWNAWAYMEQWKTPLVNAGIHFPKLPTVFLDSDSCLKSQCGKLFWCLVDAGTRLPKLPAVAVAISSFTFPRIIGQYCQHHLQIADSNSHTVG